MRREPSRLGWLPPFLLGAAAAIAGEVSISLLLYAGPGLVRSLTTILMIETAALSLGLWTAPSAPRDDLLEAVRRRWLMSLGAFVLATLYSAFWSVSEPMGGVAVGQGAGLALMAALPLYACGTTVGGVGAVTRQRGGRGVGAAALAGAVAGFAVTGFALPRALAPASLFLGCLVLLSAGGLVWGGTLDRLVRVRVKAREPSPWGEVQVEDRRLPDTDESLRVLWEGRSVRRWLTGVAEPVVPWETVVFRRWAAGREGGGRILLVGGGASALPDAAVRESPSVTVDVLERNEAVVRLAREHLAVSRPEEGGRVRVLVGPVDDGLGELGGGYDLVIVDVSALGVLGGPGRASNHLRLALQNAVGPRGALAAGPHGAMALMPPGWPMRTLERALESEPETLDVPWPATEEILVAAPSEDPVWLGAPEGSGP